MGYKMNMKKCGCGLKATKGKMGGAVKIPELLNDVKGKKELEELILREVPKKYVSFR